MRIIIDNRYFDNNQRPLVTIDTHTCTHPYAIRDAIKLALELDGYNLETINEVLGITQDVCCGEFKPKSEIENQKKIRIRWKKKNNNQ